MQLNPESILQMTPIMPRVRVDMYPPSFRDLWQLRDGGSVCLVSPCNSVGQYQKSLSGKIEDHHHLGELLEKASLPDKAQLLSASSPHAAAWLSVIPSVRLNFHPDPSEFRAVVKWWLGIAVSDNPLSPFCPSHALGPLGHHTLTCKHGRDVVSRHNRLRDVLLESC